MLTPDSLEQIIDIGVFPITITAAGVTGICVIEDRIYAALQCRPDSMILELDRGFALQREINLPNASDVHGLLLVGDDIIAVVTGANEIVRVNRELPDKPEPVWCDVDGAGDRDHLNDLTRLPDGKLLASRFGPRMPERVRSGSVMDVHSGRVMLAGLREPHSPVWWNDHLYVLESPTGDLIRGGPELVPERVTGILGYARGLYIDDDYIAIGKSAYRERSRHGLGENRTAPLTGSEHGEALLRRSGVYFIRHDGHTVNWVDTTVCGAEIYQIVALPD
jgi:hypothetical protein